MARNRLRDDGDGQHVLGCLTLASGLGSTRYLVDLAGVACAASSSRTTVGLLELRVKLLIKDEIRSNQA